MSKSWVSTSRDSDEQSSIFGEGRSGSADSGGRFELSNPLIVALDVDTREECLRLGELLAGRVGAFKVGPRLVVRYGGDLVQQLSKFAPVFIDNKYLDIPSTMEAAIRASFDAGASLATVHAWAGSEALSRMAQVEWELNRIRSFKILAVTVLTSFSQETLPPRLRPVPIADQVAELADLALNCGLTGLVCSSHEVEALRARAPHSFLVTPGVRMPEDPAGDQRRVETPAGALKKGASALVVGRPIVASPDPLVAVERLLASISFPAHVKSGDR